MSPDAKILAAVAVLVSSPVLAEPSMRVIVGDRTQQADLTSAKSACSPSTPNRRQRIIDAAALEWARFEFPRLSLTRVNTFRVVPDSLSANIALTLGGQSISPRLLTIGKMEDDTEVLERIGSYWAAVPDYLPELVDRQNAIWRQVKGAGWAEAWSAAFVSFVMCKAGFSRSEFQSAAAHVDYIRASIRARDAQDTTYKFHAYDLREAAPQPGDVICAARGTGANAINSIEDFKTKSHSAFHCDVVVGFDTDEKQRAPGVLYAIGGNVLNSVTMTETPLARQGRLAASKVPHARNWFVLLRYVGAETASMRNAPGAIFDMASRIRSKRGGH